MKFSKQGYKKNSPDRFNSMNMIPSNRITMQGVPHPILMIPMGPNGAGNPVLGQPGEDYIFPNYDMVMEFPVPGAEAMQYQRMQQGGNFYPAWMTAQRGFLQPDSPKLPQGYKVPFGVPSSELAASIGGDGEPAYLIPTFKYGEPLPNPIQEFLRTGEHLGGPFKTWQEADEWEQKVRHPYVEKGQPIPYPLLAFQPGGIVPPIDSETYRKLYESGKLATYDPETDTYTTTPLETVEITADAPDYVKFREAAKKTWPEQRYFDERVSTPFGRAVGETGPDVWHPNVQKRYDEFINNIVASNILDKYKFDESYDQNKRAEWLNQLTPQEKQILMTSPIGYKVSPTIFQKFKTGLADLANLPNYYLTGNELSYGSEYMLPEERSALNALSIFEYPSNLSAAALDAFSKGIGHGPAFGFYNPNFSGALSGQYVDAPETVKLATDPLNIVPGIGEALSEIRALNKLRGIGEAGEVMRGLGKEEALAKLSGLSGEASPLKKIAASGEGPNIPKPDFDALLKQFDLDKAKELLTSKNKMSFISKKYEVLDRLATPEGKKRIAQLLAENPQYGMTNPEEFISRLRQTTWNPDVHFEMKHMGENAYAGSRNLNTSSGSINLTKSSPHQESYPVMYLGSKFNPYEVQHIAEHEFGHVMQPVWNKKQTTSLDQELGKLELFSDNELDELDVKRFFETGLGEDVPEKYRSDTPIKSSIGLKGDKEYFLKGTGKKKTVVRENERWPFAAEVRQEMLSRGVINDMYDEITPEMLKAFHDSYKKAGYGQYNLRLLEIMKDKPENWKILSDVMNKMPVIVPGVIGAGYLMNQATSQPEEPTMQKGGSFKPHMMYHPDTKKSIIVNNYQEHLNLANMGYLHMNEMQWGGSQPSQEDIEKYEMARRYNPQLKQYTIEDYMREKYGAPEQRILADTRSPQIIKPPKITPEEAFPGAFNQPIERFGPVKPYDVDYKKFMSKVYGFGLPTYDVSTGKEGDFGINRWINTGEDYLGDPRYMHEIKFPVQGIPAWEKYKTTETKYYDPNTGEYITKPNYTPGSAWAYTPTSMTEEAQALLDDETFHEALINAVQSSPVLDRKTGNYLSDEETMKLLQEQGYLIPKDKVGGSVNGKYLYGKGGYQKLVKNLYKQKNGGPIMTEGINSDDYLNQKKAIFKNHLKQNMAMNIAKEMDGEMEDMMSQYQMQVGGIGLTNEQRQKLLASQNYNPETAVAYPSFNQRNFAIEPDKRSRLSSFIGLVPPMEKPYPTRGFAGVNYNNPRFGFGLGMSAGVTPEGFQMSSPSVGARVNFAHGGSHYNPHNLRMQSLYGEDISNLEDQRANASWNLIGGLTDMYAKARPYVRKFEISPSNVEDMPYMPDMPEYPIAQNGIQLELGKDYGVPKNPFGAIGLSNIQRQNLGIGNNIGTDIKTDKKTNTETTTTEITDQAIEDYLKRQMEEYQKKQFDQWWANPQYRGAPNPWLQNAYAPFLQYGMPVATQREGRGLFHRPKTTTWFTMPGSQFIPANGQDIPVDDTEMKKTVSERRAEAQDKRYQSLKDRKQSPKDRKGRLFNRQTFWDIQQSEDPRMLTKKGREKIAQEEKEWDDFVNQPSNNSYTLEQFQDPERAEELRKRGNYEYFFQTPQFQQGGFSREQWDQLNPIQQNSMMRYFKGQSEPEAYRNWPTPEQYYETIIPLLKAGQKKAGRFPGEMTEDATFRALDQRLPVWKNPYRHDLFQQGGFTLNVNKPQGQFNQAAGFNVPAPQNNMFSSGQEPAWMQLQRAKENEMKKKAYFQSQQPQQLTPFNEMTPQYFQQGGYSNMDIVKEKNEYGLGHLTPEQYLEYRNSGLWSDSDLAAMKQEELKNKARSKVVRSMVGPVKGDIPGEFYERYGKQHYANLPAGRPLQNLYRNMINVDGNASDYYFRSNAAGYQEGGEYELSQDEIDYIMANGGSITYID